MEIIKPRIKALGPAALFILLSAALFCLAPFRALALEVPRPQGYVTDLAGMISPAAEEKLSRLLQSFEDTDSTQIAVLTINSLEGDSLEEFSIRTAEQWKIGQQRKDNGMLLLIAKEERKIRIEVGRGLEGVMTDLMAGRVVDQVITPFFKAGQFDEGIIAGIDAMIKVTRGEFKADGRLRRGKKNGDQPPPFFTYLIIAAFFIAFLGSASRVAGAVSGAVLLPVITLFGLPVAASLLLLLILIPVGAAAGLLLPLLLAGSLSHRRGGMYYGGFGGAGGFGGGGGGFGGFGGGGFGGGGASGGW